MREREKHLLCNKTISQFAFEMNKMIMKFRLIRKSDKCGGLASL